MIEELRAIHQQIADSFDTNEERYLAPLVNWENQSICIRGARGVGKTTLLLQHYRKHYQSAETCLYISGDNIFVIANGLYAIAREHFKYGGKAIIIDEIHKYPNWAQELKNIIDTYRYAKIMISGSSSLDLTKAAYDLSRRVVYYDLTGFSFREYLHFVQGLSFPEVTLDEILTKHTKLSAQFSRIPVLKYFSDYLCSGYYPYILEGIESYYQKVSNSIEKVLFEDIAVIFNLTQPKLPILKKLLWLISTSQPFTPNIAGISRDVGISKEYVYTYLEFLEMAGLLRTVREDTGGAKMLRKPGKIYFDNPNLLYALNGAIKKETLTGPVRETFFINQLRCRHKVSLHPGTDFLVDDRYAFEIGGSSKKQKQLKGISNSFIAMDGIETGAGNKIPLYLFGLLY